MKQTPGGVGGGNVALTSAAEVGGPFGSAHSFRFRHLRKPVTAAGGQLQPLSFHRNTASAVLSPSGSSQRRLNTRNNYEAAANEDRSPTRTLITLIQSSWCASRLSESQKLLPSYCPRPAETPPYQCHHHFRVNFCAASSAR